MRKNSWLSTHSWRTSLSSKNVISRVKTCWKFAKNLSTSSLRRTTWCFSLEIKETSFIWYLVEKCQSVCRNKRKCCRNQKRRRKELWGAPRMVCWTNVFTELSSPFLLSSLLSSFTFPLSLFSPLSFSSLFPLLFFPSLFRSLLLLIFSSSTL